MDTKFYALPLNMAQLHLVSNALHHVPLQDDADIKAHADTIKYIHWLQGLIQPNEAASLYFQVLGWYPGAAQWTHLFTWRFRLPQRGLEQAANDGMPRGYTHFVIIPIPQEN